MGTAGIVFKEPKREWLSQKISRHRRSVDVSHHF